MLWSPNYPIISLGVLLYELLTGSTPLTRETLRQAAFDEVVDDRVVDVTTPGLVDEVGIVPVQAEPAEVFDELCGRLFGRAGEVGVFDAEEEAALFALIAGEQP